MSKVMKMEGGDEKYSGDGGTKGIEKVKALRVAKGMKRSSKRSRDGWR